MAASGAGTGVVLGGIIGAAAALLIPGIGPALATRAVTPARDFFNMRGPALAGPLVMRLRLITYPLA